MAMHIPTACNHALERERTVLLHGAAGVTAVGCGDIEWVVAESCDILGIARKIVLWRSSLVPPSPSVPSPFLLTLFFVSPSLKTAKIERLVRIELGFRLGIGLGLNFGLGFWLGLVIGIGIGIGIGLGLGL